VKEVIKLEKVEKVYQMGEGVEVKALCGVDLVIKENELVSVLGPSGSGKSTLLHMMGLLDSPSSGKVYIDNIDASTMSGDERAKIRGNKIGFVFQTFNLINSLSALENVELPLLLRTSDGKKRREKAKSLLEQVGLGDRMYHRPGQLSGGQRQRVAIARALVNDPEVVLADEPTGNLDSKTGQEILKILKGLHKEGRTIAIITHDEYITRVTKRVIRLMDGKVVDNR
jgi:putative ABC transport system ATP-binding protein